MLQQQQQLEMLHQMGGGLSHGKSSFNQSEARKGHPMRNRLGMGGFDPMRGHDPIQAALLGSAYHQQQIVHRKLTCFGVVSVWYRCGEGVVT